MFVRKTSKCALKNKPDIKDLKSQVTGCSDNTQRLSHRCFSLQDLQWHTSCPQKDPYKKLLPNTTQKHKFSVSQSVWSKSFWLKHTSSSHLLVPSTLSLYSLLFLLPFFFIFIPPPFPFASCIGSHLLLLLFLHVSPSLFCFDSEKKFLKEAGVSFFVLLALLLCSFSLPVCHNMGLMKELAAFCLLSNIK